MSENSVFETGTKVCLKSGGKTMMVDWGEGVPFGPMIPCVFFDDAGVFHAHEFSQVVLKIDDRMSVSEWLATDRADAVLAGD
jgi:uncharacterized protein YodC (DUF2158 family)